VCEREREREAEREAESESEIERERMARILCGYIEKKGVSRHGMSQIAPQAFARENERERESARAREREGVDMLWCTC